MPTSSAPVWTDLHTFGAVLAGALLIAVLVERAPSVGVPLLWLVVLIMLVRASQQGALKGS